MLVGVVEGDSFVFFADQEKAADLQNSDDCKRQILIGRLELREVGRVQTDGKQRNDEVHNDNDHGRAEDEVDRVNDRSNVLIGPFVYCVMNEGRENVRVHAVFDTLVDVNKDVKIFVVAARQNVSKSGRHDNCDRKYNHEESNECAVGNF